MSFVRTKQIPPGSGNYYKYLVENHWEDGKVRQETLDYLGPAAGPDDTSYDGEKELGTREEVNQIKQPKEIRNRSGEVYKDLTSEFNVDGEVPDIETTRVKTYSMKSDFVGEDIDKIKINWNKYEMLYEYNPKKADKALRRDIAHEMAHEEQLNEIGADKFHSMGSDELKNQEDSAEKKAERITAMSKEEADEFEYQAAKDKHGDQVKKLSVEEQRERG